MSPTRRSRRQAGQSPSGDELGKRARKPNSNSLASFCSKQSPLLVDKGKKRKAMDKYIPNPTPKQKGKALKGVVVELSSDMPAPPSSPPIAQNTLPNRAKNLQNHLT